MIQKVDSIIFWTDTAELDVSKKQTLIGPTVSPNTSFNAFQQSLFRPGWCFPLAFCNCALTERSCSPLESIRTSPLLTLHMCLQCFFSITYHSVPSCDCNEAFTENVWTESILSSADVCLPRRTSSSYVFIQPRFLNYASETVQFFRDTHHWSESVGPLGSLPTPRSVIVSVCMCASRRYTLSYNSLRRWMRRQWSGCFVFVFTS